MDKVLESAISRIAPEPLNAALIKALLCLGHPRWSSDLPSPLPHKGIEEATNHNDEDEVMTSLVAQASLDDLHGHGSQASECIQWYNGNLNQSQREAVEFCIKSDTFACIHGPPGVRLFAS